MSNNQVFALIETLIEKTKNSSIVWKKYSASSYDIKPLPESSLKTEIEKAYSAMSEFSSSAMLSSDNSFVAEFEDGLFFLLLYTSVIKGNEVVLRVQTKNSTTSKIFASTEDKNVTVSSQLKRLYNLIDSASYTADIDNFVNSFIKS